MGTFAPTENKTRHSTSGGHFISLGGAKGWETIFPRGVLTTAASPIRREGLAAVSFTGVKGSLEMDKPSAVAMIEDVIDVKNREAWAAQHRATVDATMRVFDALIGMVRETVEADAKRREGGPR